MSTGGETRASQRVRGRGGRAFAVDRLLHGGDEISEEHLGRRGLDAVFGIDMRVLEILGEETILYRLDKLVSVGVMPILGFLLTSRPAKNALLCTN